MEWRAAAPAFNRFDLFDPFELKTRIPLLGVGFSPEGRIAHAGKRWQHLATMKMNLRAHLPQKKSQDFRSLPILLTLETARGLSANFERSTTAQELFEVLDKRTDLNGAVIDRFREELRFSHQARITNVEMSEDLLETLGFFV